MTHSVVYIGVTSDLIQRIHQHRSETIQGFTNKYRVHKLVYFEIHQDITQAILREKQIKKWNREWKNKLITKMNPEWNDLYPQLVGE